MVKKLLEDLKIKIEIPLKLYTDNKKTIGIAYDLVQYDRTKHVKIDIHFIKEKLKWNKGSVCRHVY